MHDREPGGEVLRHHLARELAAVEQRDPDLAAAEHDVVDGHDQAARVDERAAPERSVPSTAAEGCDSGTSTWRCTVAGSVPSSSRTDAFTIVQLPGARRGREMARRNRAAPQRARVAPCGAAERSL